VDLREVGKTPQPVKEPAAPAHEVGKEKPAKQHRQAKGNHRHSRLVIAGGVRIRGVHVRDSGSGDGHRRPARLQIRKHRRGAGVRGRTLECQD